jgi:Cu(I)/Ag(I) efflux system membrane fusion protein
MLYVRDLFLSGAVLTVAAVLGGCGSPSNPASTPAAGPDSKAAAKTAAPDAAAPDAAAAKSDAPSEGLAGLSEADRALAVAQRVCPVSGELLGSMGKPFKVTVKGRTFFLCCDGCQEELNKDPDKFLAKLKK